MEDVMTRMETTLLIVGIAVLLLFYVWGPVR